LVYKARKINKRGFNSERKDKKGGREVEDRTHKERGLNVLGRLTQDINSLTTLQRAES